jgi:hypothetical protein
VVFLTKTGDVWTLHDEVSPLRLRSRRLGRPDGLLDRDRPARTAKFELTLGKHALAPALDLVGIEAKREMPQLTDGQSPLAARSCTAATPYISRCHSPSDTAKPRFLQSSISGSVRRSTISHFVSILDELPSTKGRRYGLRTVRAVRGLAEEVTGFFR